MRIKTTHFETEPFLDGSDKAFYFDLIDPLTYSQMLEPTNDYFLGAAPMLFFANRHDIRKRSLGAAPTYESVVKFLKGAVSIDFHKKSGYVYWTDVISEQIQKAKVILLCLDIVCHLIIVIY